MANKPLLFPPLCFSYVEETLFRSAVPIELNFGYLETLKLKSIIFLGETPNQKLIEFMRNNTIQHFCIENAVSGASMGGSLNHIPIGDDIVIAALEILSNRDNYPALVCCRSGKFISGVVIGCLRKLQRWSLMSIFEEYRRMASYTGSVVQQQHEQFIELFDTDLVPITQAAPEFMQSDCE